MSTRPTAAPPRARRVAAGIGLAVVAAAVVVGLGLLADLAAGSRGGGAGPVPVPVPVTVGASETVWDVARRVAPEAEGPELSSVAERIVTANSLTSAQVQPGQVLQVPLGPVG